MMLVRAVDWIDRHLSRFTGTADSALEWRLASSKAIGELAHAADMLTRRTDALRAAGERWLAHAWNSLDGIGWVLPLLEATPRLALVASLLPVFHQRGWVDPTTVARLHAALLRAPLDHNELVYAIAAFRALGVTLPSELEERAASRAVLIQRPAPWQLDLPALYQFTHEIFYASAWGARPADLDDNARRYARRWIPMWIEVAARTNDADMLAELLCCHEIVDISETVDAAWDVLARAQIDDGGVTPPSRQVDVRAMATPNDDFLSRRHTTLVAVMAWSLRDQSMPNRSTPP